MTNIHIHQQGNYTNYRAREERRVMIISVVLKVITKSKWRRWWWWYTKQSGSGNPAPLWLNEIAHRKHLPHRKLTLLWQIRPLLFINWIHSFRREKGGVQPLQALLHKQQRGQRTEITSLTANKLSLWYREGASITRRGSDGGGTGCKNADEP